MPLGFIIASSPTARDLEKRTYTIHTPPTEKDEEFWVSGHARRVEQSSTDDQLAAVMTWARPGHGALFEFELDVAGWTTWLDFNTPNHRPRHHRWRSRLGGA